MKTERSRLPMGWLRRQMNAQVLSVAAIVCFSLAVRLYFSWDWNAIKPDSPLRLRADEPGYNNLARDLLAGYGFTWPGRVPLYPVWLAGLFTLSGGSFKIVPYAQSLFGAAVVLLTYILARLTFNHRSGLIAALVASVSYILINQSLRLLSEILYTPAILLATIALWHAFRRPQISRFAVAGALIGLCNMIRPTLFLFPCFIAVVIWALYRERRALVYGGALVLAAMLVVAPWMIRNYVRYQAIYPLATSNAILWQGSPEYFHLIRDKGYTYDDVWNKVIYGPEGEGNDAGSVEGDRYWTQRAIRSIIAEPGLYAYFVLEKFVTYWVGDPSADWAETYVFNYQALLGFGHTPAIAIQYMIARGLILIALPALLIVRKQWRALLPILLMLSYHTLLHGITHAEARLSEPLQPFLLILIAGAGVSVWDTYSAGGSRRPAMSALSEGYAASDN